MTQITTFPTKEARPKIWPLTDRANAPVSRWKKATIANGTPPDKALTFQSLFALMTDENNKPLVSLTDKMLSRLAKEGKSEAFKKWRAVSLPVVIPGDHKGKGELLTYTPVIWIDVDGMADFEVSFTLSACEKIPFIYAAFASPSRQGLRILVCCNSTPNTHKAYYKAVCEAISQRLDIPLKSALTDVEGPHVDDVSTDAINHVWFYTHVPRSLFYKNENSAVFELDAAAIATTPTAERQPVNGQRQPKITRGEGYKYEFTQWDKVGDMIRQIEAQRLDLTPGKTGNWFKIGCALFDEFGDKGREYFHRISCFHPKYNPTETDQQFDECRSKHKGRIKIGTFYQLCERAGINVDYSYLTAQHRTAASRQPTQAPAPAAAAIPVVPADAPALDELPAPDDDNLSIVDGCYFWTNNNKGRTEERISNFIIRPLYLLTDSQEPKRVWEIVNRDGHKATLCLPVKYLSRPSELATEFEGKGKFVPSWTPKQFARIKEYLFTHEQPAEEISVLGYQPGTGYYAFADAVFDGSQVNLINSHGIASAGNKLFYLPAFSSVNDNEAAKREYHNERKFRYQAGTSKFSDWSNQLVKVFGNNGKVGICFVVAAIFRDIVFEYVKSFPILFLFGPSKTGKSTFRLSLKRLFGDYKGSDSIGLGSASSAKGFARKLAQICNGLEIFEEYKNGINPSLIEMLKNVYDGIGYERAQTTNDNRTHATLVNSAVIVAGQEMPTKENALFSRVIMLTFGKANYSPQEREAFQRLEGMIGDGLGAVLLEILQYRQQVENGFGQAFNQVYGHLRKDPATVDLDERTLNNVAAILAPLKVLASALPFPFDYKEAYQVLRDRISEQHAQMSKASEVSQFWQIFDYLAGSGQIAADTHYKVSDDLLYIRLDSIFPRYVEQGIKQRAIVLDASTLESYLEMQPAFKRPQGKGKKFQQRFGGERKNCLGFALNLLELENIGKLPDSDTL